MPIEKWDEVNGTATPAEKMQAFLESGSDCYAILQLKRTDETVQERYESYSALQRKGMEPNIDHYEVVYVAPLEADRFQTPDDLSVYLERVYTIFNIGRPADFHGHSLSVSDIVALQQSGVVSCHYVDSIGYKELPSFLNPEKERENYLKNAEIQMEDDYGMIDGIINNGKSSATEDDERASVLEQLKAALPKAERPKPPRCPEERSLD
jgi:hypothetical protein